jgi:hypothetical protein
MTFTEDQQPVSDLGADGEHEPLREAIRAGTSGWDLDRIDTDISQDGIELGGELPGRVADQEPEVLGTVLEIHDQVADLLSGPVPVRVRGDSKDVYLPATNLDHEQAIQPPQRDRAVHVKKSTASMPLACARRNARHVVSVARSGAGGTRRVLRTRRIVEALTWWPSLPSSPWIRW